MRVTPIASTHRVSDYANRSLLARPVKYRIENLEGWFVPVVSDVFYPSQGSENSQKALRTARYLANKKVTQLMQSGIRARAVEQRPHI